MGYPVNKYNFLRWDDLGNNPDADTTTEPAKGYIIDPLRCDGQPIIQLGEAFRFYVNAEVGTDWITDTCTLNLINSITGATTLANCAPLLKDLFTVGVTNTYNYYAEVVLAAIDVPAGIYHFDVVGPTPTFKVWMRSNRIIVIATTDTKMLNSSSLCRWRHDRYYYGFRYQALADFTNQMRLRINQINQQEESSVEVYKEQTTGERRQYNQELDLLRTFECYYFSDEEYTAAMIMFKSSDFYLNGRQYLAKDALNNGASPRSKQNKSNIQMYDQEFSSLNRCNP